VLIIVLSPIFERAFKLIVDYMFRIGVFIVVGIIIVWLGLIECLVLLGLHVQAR